MARYYRGFGSIRSGKLQSCYDCALITDATGRNSGEVEGSGLAQCEQNISYRNVPILDQIWWMRIFSWRSSLSCPLMRLKGCKRFGGLPIEPLLMNASMSQKIFNVVVPYLGRRGSPQGKPSTSAADNSLQETSKKKKNLSVKYTHNLLEQEVRWIVVFQVRRQKATTQHLCWTLGLQLVWVNSKRQAPRRYSWELSAINGGARRPYDYVLTIAIN